MKQTTVTIKYDEESLNAIRQYMNKKDADFEAEMNEVLGKLYEKYVPQAVREYIEEPFVFALDEALMCHSDFLGRSDEYIIWVYGPDSLRRFNGIVILGNEISPYNIQSSNGLTYTDFNRTLSDALANESILDMQGITEALGNYYYSHNESFDGIYVPPEYTQRFESLAADATDYYAG